MSESGLRKIGVIGIGTMGNGIAQVAAQGGYDTIVRELKDHGVSTIFISHHLDETFELTARGNYEVLVEWLTIAAASACEATSSFSDGSRKLFSSRTKRGLVSTFPAA